MIQKLYAIRDQLSTYKAPFIMPNDKVAEREFKAIVNDSKSGMYYAPEYFDLYYIGEFDDNTGDLKPNKPTLLCNGAAVKEKKENV